MSLDCVILGAGGWGTALACLLARNGKKVGLWARRAEFVQEMAATRQNERYLTGITIPSSVAFLSELELAVTSASVIILAVPTVGIRQLSRQIAKLVQGKTIVNTSKGLDPSTGKRMSEIIQEEICTSKVLVLSGPNHAEEVARQLPTITVLAGEFGLAQDVRALLMNQTFRVYTNPDVIGVEIAGGAKNVIALAAGISDGLGYGDNAKSAVITRGIAEISRLGEAYGALPGTFSGIAGLGDLIATCTSEHSRNRRAGQLVAEGANSGAFLPSGQVVEGIPAVDAVLLLADKVRIEMPIAQAVKRILAGEPAREIVAELMDRDAKREIYF